MIIKWNPFWYGLDQSIVVGDTDLFYLQRDVQSFANGPVSIKDREVEAEILEIAHPILGQIRGIVTEELDYSLFLNNGKRIVINAEEEPGQMDNQQLSIADWCMEVKVQILQNTGFTSYDRMSQLTDLEKIEQKRRRVAKYRELLEL